MMIDQGPDAAHHSVRAPFLGGEAHVDRAPFALAGASFSATDLASARDRLRLVAAPGAALELAPPGEAAVFVLIGPGDGRDDRSPVAADAWTAAMGDCGPVAGLWGVLG